MSDHTPTKKIMIDEMSYYLESLASNEHLKERIRSCLGVPNAEFKGSNGKVFLFKKLYETVNQRILENPDANLETVVDDCLDMSFISPEELAKDHPESLIRSVFQPVILDNGKHGIRHDIFDCNLDVEFEHFDEAILGIANLIAENPLGGKGHFNFHGIGLKIDSSLSVDDLPKEPEFRIEKQYWDAYLADTFASLEEDPLQGVNHVPGFVPLTRTEFLKTKRKVNAWKKKKARIKVKFEHCREELWAMIPSIIDESKLFGSIEFKISKKKRNKIHKKIISKYPLCKGISKKVIVDLYLQFKEIMNEHYCGEWKDEKEGSPEFLIYILCSLTQMFDYEFEDKGYWIGLSLLEGRGIDDSFSFYERVSLYEKSLQKLAFKVSSICRYLSNWEEMTYSGSKIVLLDDIFRMSRKYNAQLSAVTQKLSDFSVNGA